MIIITFHKLFDRILFKKNYDFHEHIDRFYLK